MHALERMADALLRGCGGEKVTLRMPAPAIAGDPAEQMGLAQPQFQDFVLVPVTFRRLRPKVGAKNEAAGYELLVSATAVETLLTSLAYEAASVLFQNAAGVLVGEALLRVDSCTAVEMFGGVILYRIQLHDPLALLV
ncbi:hypothetical protein [Granulicella rosea]|nr:hypothetical protein [Granulicella rosea]